MHNLGASVLWNRNSRAGCECALGVKRAVWVEQNFWEKDTEKERWRERERERETKQEIRR